MTFSWTQPQCHTCWDTQNPQRMSVRVVTVERERCVTCGEETFDGIYIRINPDEARYPTKPSKP